MTKNKCFCAGTKIAQPGGKNKNIEDIQVGDIILGFNVLENKYVETKVLNVSKRTTNNIIKIESNDKVIYCTPQHPFYNIYRQLVKAVEIGKGTMLLCRDGRFRTVNSVEKIEKECEVYNFETQCHTYIAEDYLTHNCNLSEE